MESRYVAEFRISEITGEQVEERKKDANEVVSKERTFDSKTVGKAVATGVAVTLVGSQMYAKTLSTSNSITGDAIAQRRLDNSMAFLNEGLSVFGTLAGGLLIGGPVGAGVAAVGLTTKYLMQTFNTSQANMVKQAQWQIESKVNAERNNRLVKDITGIRI